MNAASEHSRIEGSLRAYAAILCSEHFVALPPPEIRLKKMKDVSHFIYGLARRKHYIAIQYQANVVDMHGDLIHELAHYWLYKMDRPTDHTEEFWEKVYAVCKDQGLLYDKKSGRYRCA